MMQNRQSEEAMKKLKSDLDQRQKEEDQRDRIIQERWRLEDQENKLKNELVRQTMQQQMQVMNQVSDKAKIEQRLREQELEKELQLLKIEEQGDSDN